MPVLVGAGDRLAATMAGELDGLMVRLRRTLRRKVREGLAPEQLSGPAVELLQVVRSHPGLRVGEAARRLAALATALDGLSSSDRRALGSALPALGRLVEELDHHNT